MNGLYSEMTAAMDWGLTPRQWYAASRGERAMMLATCAMKARAEAVVTNGDK